MEKKEFLVLGKPVRHPITELDTVPCPPTVTRVVMTSDEVTALCPITGQPDYYTVTIAFEPRGSSGFGYDPIFYIPELGKTMAELPMEVKNRISHRARAARKAREILERWLREEACEGSC